MKIICSLVTQLFFCFLTMNNQMWRNLYSIRIINQAIRIDNVFSINQTPITRPLHNTMQIQSVNQVGDVTDARATRVALHCTIEHEGARDERAGVLTFGAVLTGGGERLCFLYQQYDTTARDHPILGGCQPGLAATLSDELSFHLGGSVRASRPSHIRSCNRGCIFSCNRLPEFQTWNVFTK